jgi:CheY-like chemotaxis protein
MGEKRILIVGKERVVLTKAESALSELSLPPALKQNIKEAEKEIAENPPDLIILDISSEADLSLLAAVSRLHLRPAIIVLAGENELPLISKSLNLGADDYLTKPFRPKDLALRVHLLLIEGAGEKETALTSLSGTLSEVNIAELIRGCEQGLLTGEVTVIGDGDKFVIVFSGGKVKELRTEKAQEKNAIDKLLKLTAGNFIINQYPFALKKRERGKVKEELTPAPPEITASGSSLGRLSSLDISGKNFQIQTELYTSGDPRITTLVIRDGQIYRKIEKLWLKAEESELSEKIEKVNHQHQQVVTTLNEVLPLILAKRDITVPLLIQAIVMVKARFEEEMGSFITLYYLNKTRKQLSANYPFLSKVILSDKEKPSIPRDLLQENRGKLIEGIARWLFDTFTQLKSYSSILSDTAFRQLTGPLEYKLDWIGFFDQIKP